MHDPRNNIRSQMNSDPINGGRGRESDEKWLPEKQRAAATNEEDGSWPHFEEDDYIVFCFTEDGEIHVVEDRRSESSSTIPRTNKKLRPLGRRLMYEENGERDNYGDKGRGDIVVSLEKGEESGSTDGEGRKETILTRDDDGDDDGGMTLESSESRSGQYDQSSASRSSFAFPVLGWEWAGSPVHMPKPDGPFSKKQRARRLFIHCCGF